MARHHQRFSLRTSRLLFIGLVVGVSEYAAAENSTAAPQMPNPAAMFASTQKAVEQAKAGEAKMNESIQMMKTAQIQFQSQQRILRGKTAAREINGIYAPKIHRLLEQFHKGDLTEAEVVGKLEPLLRRQVAAEFAGRTSQRTSNSHKIKSAKLREDIEEEVQKRIDDLLREPDTAENKIGDNRVE